VNSGQPLLFRSIKNRRKAFLAFLAKVLIWSHVAHQDWHTHRRGPVVVRTDWKLDSLSWLDVLTKTINIVAPTSHFLAGSITD
jgi:hypothetical protein